MKANMKPFEFKYYQDKQMIFEYYCKYLFTRTQSMFVYEGLPDTIPVQWLEQYLQQNGSCGIAKVKGEFYALLGSAGGEPDPYYQPTLYTVANPALNLSETYEIGKDCVYARNDYTGIGLVPLISRYCGMMTENLVTIRASDIGMRNIFTLTAPDDDSYQSAQSFIKKLENGDLDVISENPFFEGVKLLSTGRGNGDYMIQFIELHQYLKGSLYNELGLNANFNMKRESLSSAELGLNNDALTPLIDDMLKQRRLMCSDLKDVFGLEVKVDYGSAWHSNVVEKAVVAGEEYAATDEAAVEIAGDEANLPDDDAADESSQLNVATEKEEINADGHGETPDGKNEVIAEVDKEVVDSESASSEELATDDGGGNRQSEPEAEEAGESEDGSESSGETNTEEESGNRGDSEGDSVDDKSEDKVEADSPETESVDEADGSEEEHESEDTEDESSSDGKEGEDVEKKKKEDEEK